jgi:TetR/AcrR family transcriptional repressor of nem operon
MARTREFDTDRALERALQVFWCQGYEGTSIEDVVQATGVQRGSLYAAFGSKEGLYHAVLDRYREQLAAPLLAALAGGAEVRSLVRSVLLGMVDEAVDDEHRRGCLMVNAATQRLAADEGVARRVRDTVGAMEDALAGALAAGQAQGQIARDADPRALARFLVLTVQGVRVMGVIEPDRAALTQAVEVALACLR